MVPNRDILIAQAIEQTGLSDFGDTWFFAHIDVLIPALNKQARLSPEGLYAAQHMIVSNLVSRLRHKQFLKDNPEILNETVL